IFTPAVATADPVATVPSAAAGSVAVPAPAPSPTDSGNSPMAPDPHPPVGGIAPNGTHVGGPNLRSRGLIVPHPAPPLPESLTAQAWVLVDLDSGNVLAARDPHGRYQPASILKWLTSVTLIPLLPGTRPVTASEAAAQTEPTRAGLVAGGHYTVDELFRGLLLHSGNDCATALAEAAGGYQHTVALMNAMARQLGAYDTFVQTPSGLDGWQQLTSAYDMALVMRAALGLPRLVNYARTLTSTLPWQAINGYGPVTLQNQNTTFLTSVPGAIAAKTGFTDAAQQTFVGAIERHGRRLGVAFLRGQRWPVEEWQQATDLMNWGFGLPATTPPVGHLDGPIGPAPASAAHSRAAARAGRIARASGPHGQWVYPVGGAAVLVAATPLAWGWRRRHRRPRAR
ncbi:MAG: hypothetical protein QOG80_143, partial [Pseudonocardiales bacterium]|nr:hypothetical protein [Pseudonocardiales bacterium]